MYSAESDKTNLCDSLAMNSDIFNNCLTKRYLIKATPMEQIALHLVVAGATGYRYLELNEDKRRTDALDVSMC